MSTTLWRRYPRWAWHPARRRGMGKGTALPTRTCRQSAQRPRPERSSRVTIGNFLWQGGEPRARVPMLLSGFERRTE